MGMNSDAGSRAEAHGVLGGVLGNGAWPATGWREPIAMSTHPWGESDQHSRVRTTGTWLPTPRILTLKLEFSSSRFINQSLAGTWFKKPED